MASTRLFSDLDLSFTAHPVTKDILAKYDDNAIKNAVKNLVLTRHFERLFHSEIGSNVNNMMFENANPGVVLSIRDEIYDVINNFEPRVDLLEVDVKFSPDQHLVMVTIIFKIKNTVRPITLQFALERTR